MNDSKIINLYWKRDEHAIVQTALFLESFYGADFWDADGRGSYTEQVFAVSPEELQNMRFFGVFSSFGCRTNGDWEITVPLKTLR